MVRCQPRQVRKPLEPHAVPGMSSRLEQAPWKVFITLGKKSGGSTHELAIVRGQCFTEPFRADVAPEEGLPSERTCMFTSGWPAGDCDPISLEEPPEQAHEPGAWRGLVDLFEDKIPAWLGHPRQLAESALGVRDVHENAPAMNEVTPIIVVREVQDVLAADRDRIGESFLSHVRARFRQDRLGIIAGLDLISPPSESERVRADAATDVERQSALGPRDAFREIVVAELEEGFDRGRAIAGLLGVVDRRLVHPPLDTIRQFGGRLGHQVLSPSIEGASHESHPNSSPGIEPWVRSPSFPASFS